MPARVLTRTRHMHTYTIIMTFIILNVWMRPQEVDLRPTRDRLEVGVGDYEYGHRDMTDGSAVVSALRGH